MASHLTWYPVAHAALHQASHGIPCVMVVRHGVPLCRACRRPDRWPGRFGFHEVFHAATIVAFLLHYSAVWITAVGV